MDRTMTTWRWKATALTLSLALLASWAGAAGRPAGDAELAAWVDERVRDWQPTPEERRFDEIGWARDIRDALRLAREQDRPVFLFTYDGTSLATYRC
jgi:hypothetical protein